MTGDGRQLLSGPPWHCQRCARPDVAAPSSTRIGMLYPYVISFGSLPGLFGYSSYSALISDMPAQAQETDTSANQPSALRPTRSSIRSPEHPEPDGDRMLGLGFDNGSLSPEVPSF